jgi:BirA family transcriptional regulator, biotin operon repressor / biotin---[acetyl-CoA-carboxylase] ligase
VQRIAIEFGVDGDSGDAEFAAGANDSNGDLTAVGYQYLGEHVLMVSRMDPTGATSAARFLPLGTAVADDVGPGSLRHVAQTGSTNADLVDEARRGNANGAVLVADHQTAGRGRLDRQWIDDPGAALLLSLRVPVEADGAGELVRALGAAARTAVDSLCASRVLMKWPNDLVVSDGPAPGKLAGVLAEFVAAPVPCVVVGIGINVAPMGRQDGATSVVECGGPDDRDAVLSAVLQEFAARRTNPSDVMAELQAHSATIGSRVRVELPAEELVGRAVDLTADGQLVVDDDLGVRHVVGVGDVVHLRPA